MHRSCDVSFQYSALHIAQTASALGYHPLFISSDASFLRQQENRGWSGTVCRFEPFTSVFDVAKKLAMRYRIQAVFPLHEKDVLGAALLREENNIPGMVPSQAVLFRDKNRMHRRAQELGLMGPRSLSPFTFAELEQFIEEVGYPIIIKPVAGADWEDVYQVQNFSELLAVWNRMRHALHRFRAEAFIYGRQFHIVSLVHSGQIVFAMATENGTLKPRMHRFPDWIDWKSQMLVANERLLLGFGLIAGVAHSEFYLSDSGHIVFGEVAARLGSGSIAPLFLNELGLNLAAEWCRVTLMEHYALPEFRSERTRAQSEA